MISRTLRMRRDLSLRLIVGYGDPNRDMIMIHKLVLVIIGERTPQLDIVNDVMGNTRNVVITDKYPVFMHA